MDGISVDFSDNQDQVPDINPIGIRLIRLQNRKDGFEVVGWFSGLSRKSEDGYWQWLKLSKSFQWPVNG